ncbi:catechol 2,3-dioxygenase-like lactoylglutathione lyase family enzyme [Sphingobium sp. B1D7B]|uniref:VOC family protein n=1 Tax=unclassified Sphingobium TaxID=2611147 RepID=UPI0022247D9D|nr:MULTISPECIES: VOC family protein [unclassified Sphingobium]MCW2392835.1 catechol 2,3-dioxygenase-like lactoylglutathione lyase family enzyme [Sphingobium sp. B11D3A]MCW2404569.1 catechol 2,3-dioxygenase-like lactoylglutathione lyase family enzyme [Sphingobium sp. B1D7B]
MSRVTEIRYVGYAVTDFATESSFYEGQWGLERVPSDDGMAWFKTQGHDEHHVVRLRPSDENRVDVIALAADSRADVDALCERVRASAAKLVSEPQDLTTPGGGYGFRFFTPDGLLIEVSSDVARGEAREITRWEGLPVKISHIVLHSPDHQAAVRFFCDVLGFKVSDWLGDFMCFLRCNSAHHRIALLPGPPCLNHVAYDMTDVDGMMAGISRLKQNKTDIRWGPGRHTAGDNTFSYFVTPSGFAVEYTAELEDVDFETHEPKVHVPAPRVMDQWGIGVGGPQTMPHPEANPGLFVAVEA